MWTGQPIAGVNPGPLPSSNLKTKGYAVPRGDCPRLMKKPTARDNYLRIVDYLGGRCADCKRVFPIYVYDVHCPDATEKDFSFADNPKLRPFDQVKPLLDKCVLVCANCHRIRHRDEVARRGQKR